MIGTAVLCLAAVLVSGDPGADLPAPERVDPVESPDVSRPGLLYPGNRPPLLPSPFIKLPAGSIRPLGWLRRQLELEAAGFTGRLTELSGFCRPQDNAWLSPEGKGHSGWEEVPYWLRGFAHLAYVLGDERLIAEARPWIEALFASRREDGWFGPRQNLGDGERGPDLMPNMSMLAVLQVHHEATGDPRVLDLMARYFRWELAVPDAKFFAGGWQFPRGGDNLASVYWLYNRTGEAWLLELAAKLMRCGASWLSEVNGGHNVDFSQGFRKPAVYYQQSRDPAHLAASIRNWDAIHAAYGQVPGGMFGGDEFARPGHGDPRQAIETCGIVEMLKSEIILHQITGDPRWADRCEDATLNSLPASMTADMKALRYLTSPNQVNSDARSKDPELSNGGRMQVLDPRDHRCCQHNSGMGWPFFADHLWQATPDGGLAAVYFAESEVQARVGDGARVTIRESTRYPFDGVVTLTLACDSPVDFPLYLRIPGWCAAPRVAISGRPVEAATRPGSYLRIERRWATGDAVRLELPMDVRVRVWEKNAGSVSVDRGPLTFSLRIEEEYRRAGGTDEWPAWEILPRSPWNYGLVLDPKGAASSFEVVERPWPEAGPIFALDTVPIDLRARARKIPSWKEDYVGLVDKLQPSPVRSSEPVETVALVPMGAARLRIAAFPTIGEGPDAREWSLPAEPMASFHRGPGVDPVSAISDGRLPKCSYDLGTPRFTWWSWSQFGKRQWVRQDLGGERTVSGCEVYWFDESPANADCRVPKWWRILWKDGEEWREVANPSGYGIAVDGFNKVTFDPVTTASLRLEVQCQEHRSAGVYEWRIVPAIAPR